MFTFVPLMLLGSLVLGQTVEPPNSKAYSSRLWSTSPSPTWNNSYVSVEPPILETGADG